ncbi:MAG: 4Fe-4S binding protein [Chloroflexota bacterium]
MIVGESLKSGSFARRAPRGWRRLRQATQTLALALFLYLLVGTQRQFTTFLPHDLFFRLDPLAGVLAMLAARAWIAPLALGSITLLLTVALGRAWCGWLCPLGTILDWVPGRHNCAGAAMGLSSHWRLVKYFLLFSVLLAAAMGSLTLIILDPIALLSRTTAAVVLPAFNLLVTGLESWLYGIRPLQPALEWLDGLMRGWLLNEQPFFLPNLLLAAVFAGVLGLNAVRPRFWCRYLCPLGGLLGLVSKLAHIRYAVDTDRCIACRHCAVTCPAGAIDTERKFAASPSECMACLDCLDSCPTEAISFTSQPRTDNDACNPSRRRFLSSVAAAVVGASLLRWASHASRTYYRLVRPPGTSDEEFMDRCIRCGECIRVCPTGGLQPSNSASGWDGLWTPTLVSRAGYCDYSCNACGQVCPTGAITNLSLAEKRVKVIGLAVIDEKRCIPFAEGRECIVCEEMCPIPTKAVRLERQKAVVNREGIATVHLPEVVNDLCTGCGICEHQCPVDGEAAIRIEPPEPSTAL